MGISEKEVFVRYVYVVILQKYKAIVEKKKWRSFGYDGIYVVRLLSPN